jgi:hypothetical protein
MGTNPDYSIPQIDAVRNRLLHAATDHAQDGFLDREDFTTGDPIREEDLLWALYGWCRSSRRIYGIPADLQLLLQATSLNGAWDGIKLPFNTFSMSLDEPLESDGERYDEVLVHAHGTLDGLEGPRIHSFILLSEAYRLFEPMERKAKEQILRALNRKDGSTLGRIARKAIARRHGHCRCFSFETIPPDEAPDGTPMAKGTMRDVLSGLEEGFNKTTGPSWSRLIPIVSRLAFGLSIYLRTRPPQTRPTTAPLKAVQRGVPRILTQDAHVCLVQNEHALNENERTTLRAYANGNMSIEASPHFREGYYSRPPGKGTDPLAEKTIWHRPTIVRRDLLPNGTLPYGRKTRL